MILSLFSLVFPKWILLFFFCIIVFADFITGVSKSNKKNISTKTTLIRLTYTKLLTYVSLLVCWVILINIGVILGEVEKSLFVNISSDLLLASFIYVEVLSIVENLIEMNTNCEGGYDEKGNPVGKCEYSNLAITILIPISNILKLKLKNMYPKIN